MTASSDILKSRLGTLRPGVAIILGSSLGPIADAVNDRVTMPFSDLPDFPRPTVSGHSGEVIAGRLGGADVIVLKGRAHAYETGNAAAMRGAILSLAETGIRTLLLTNAAGSLVPAMGSGSIMLITDHINLSGMNPLIGELGDERFVSLTNAYDRGLCGILKAAALREQLALHEGVYAWFSGPSFETPAEIRMAQVIGAQAVGMSTAPETILARRFGLKVVALSVITNLGAGIGGASPSHEETKEQGGLAAGRARQLIAAAMRDLSHG